MAHPGGKVKAEGQPPSSPKVKQEPAEMRVCLDLPDAKRSQSHGNSQLLYRPPKLPFRPPNSEGESQFEPPAETISWHDSPPFPRALHRRDPLAALSDPKSASSWEPGEIRESAHSRDQVAYFFDRDRPAEHGTINTTPRQPVPADLRRAPEQKRASGREGRRNPAMSAPPGRQLRGIVPVGLNMYSQPTAKAAKVNPNTVPAGAPTQPRMQSSAPVYRASNAPVIGPTQLLSQECQRRRFNPEWVIRENHDGTIKCAVKLLQHTVSTNKTYPSLSVAKHAIAEKALKEIQNWPTATDVAREYCRDHLESIRVNQEHHARSLAAAKSEEDTVMADVPAAGAREDRATRATSRAHDIDRAAEQARLLDQVQRMTRGAVPDGALDNPESTRMFFEGLLAGARLFDPAPRSRSRSPGLVNRAPTGYRERSPPSGLIRPSSSGSRRAAPSSEGLCYSDPDEPTAMSALPVSDYYPRRRANTDKYRPEYPQRPSEQEWPHDKFRP